jgi:hypothetical protein
LKLQKSPKQHPNPARKPEKTWQKVAETAKIPKTAPKTQP